MSCSNYDHKRGLECLRLAANLTRLAADTFNPHLREHCLRMAKVWSDEALEEQVEDAWAGHTGVQNAISH